MGPQTGRSWPHKAVDINHERADINAGLIYARQVCRQSKAPLIKMKMQRNAATDFGFVRLGRETKKDRERKSESERERDSVCPTLRYEQHYSHDSCAADAARNKLSPAAAAAGARARLELKLKLCRH